MIAIKIICDEFLNNQKNYVKKKCHSDMLTLEALLPQHLKFLYIFILETFKNVYLQSFQLININPII